MRHIYDKLGAHRRTEAVERAGARPARTLRPEANLTNATPWRHARALARVIRSGRRALIPPPTTVTWTRPPNHPAARVRDPGPRHPRGPPPDGVPRSRRGHGWRRHLLMGRLPDQSALHGVLGHIERSASSSSRSAGADGSAGSLVARRPLARWPLARRPALRAHRFPLLGDERLPVPGATYFSPQSTGSDDVRSSPCTRACGRSPRYAATPRKEYTI